MKGVSLPIETIIILALAIIVLGVLIWFFTTSSTPAIELTKLKQDQSIWCSSYQQNNPDCDDTKHREMAADQNSNIIPKIVEICSNLNSKEGGYSSCTTSNLRPEDANPCIKQCCRMYCGGTTTT